MRLGSNPRANAELTKASEMPVSMRRHDRVPSVARQNASRKMAGPTVELHRPDTLRYDLIQVNRGDDEARHRRPAPNLPTRYREHGQWDGGCRFSVRRAMPTDTRNVDT